MRDERTGKLYTPSYQVQLHRKVRAKAGLPAEVNFTSLRHGGITNIGDSGTDDVCAVRGHNTLEVTRIYNKANREKARCLAAERREHIALVAGATTTNDQEVR